VAELKPKRTLTNGKGPLELALWTSRHSERDLEEIGFIIAGYPGLTPVHLHFQNSAGRRVTMEMGAAFQVKRSVELEDELARWIEE
jgi:DNA polymerase-3 subunit alpha